MKRGGQILVFLVCWIRMLFYPWKWQRAVGVTAELISISVSVSSTAKLCQGRLFSCSSQGNVLSLLKPNDSRTKENRTTLFPTYNQETDLLLINSCFVLLFPPLLPLFGLSLSLCFQTRIKQKVKLCIFE